MSCTVPGDELGSQVRLFLLGDGQAPPGSLRAKMCAGGVSCCSFSVLVQQLGFGQVAVLAMVLQTLLQGLSDVLGVADSKSRTSVMLHHYTGNQIRDGPSGWSRQLSPWRGSKHTPPRRCQVVKASSSGVCSGQPQSPRLAGVGGRNAVLVVGEGERGASLPLWPVHGTQQKGQRSQGGKALP